MRIETARKIGDPEKITNATLNLASILCYAGNYTNSLYVLDSIQPQNIKPTQKEYYFSVYADLYSKLGNTALTISKDKEYRQKVYTFQDSMLRYSSNTYSATMIHADWLLKAGKTQKALKLLSAKQAQEIGANDASYFSLLSECYKALGDLENEKKFLAKAVIIDLENNIKEYSSLISLANLLYTENDIERSYRYINRALKDAVESKSNIRINEIVSILPIIESTYLKKEQERKNLLSAIIITTSTLAIGLLLALYMLKKKQKKLKKLGFELHQQYQALQTANDKLEESNKIKECYIQELFGVYSEYIQKMETSRKNLFRLMKANKFEEVFRIVKNTDLKANEIRLLHADFDRIFLNMFPDFITDFNKIVYPEYQFDVKDPYTLPSELRVMALVRLGFNSNIQIAEFLHYSPQTVYNYRSRINNIISIPKEDLEKRVATLGRPS